MNIHIGKLIKREMIQQGLKPGELAERIWVTRTNIYNIFERESIDTELLKRICKALHTNFFSPLAEEIGQEDDKTVFIEKQGFDKLGFIVQGNNESEAFQEAKTLFISLLVNGSGFDETIELPQEIFPLLSYAYDCAIEGPLKGMDDDQIDNLLFPWLEINHPKLAAVIKDSVTEMLTERIADDTDGSYRDYIYYNEPTSEDEWFSLGENEIRYFIDDIHERIKTVRRPLTWKGKSL
jgi:DNA-binding Xre family transcriptional regulator